MKAFYIYDNVLP